MIVSKTVRVALAYLCVIGFLVGAWALGFPLAFYEAFPGFGHAWVSADGPYNEHLVRDVGALNVSTGVVAGVGLIRPALVAPFTVGVATLVYNLSHFIYHLSKLRLYSPVDQAGNVIALGSALIASLVLVVCGRRAIRPSVAS